MASRGGLRGYGLASGIELLTNLNLERQKQNQELKNKAIELYATFSREKQLEDIRFRHEAALKGFDVDPVTGVIRRPSLSSILSSVGTLPAGGKINLDIPGGVFTQEGPKLPATKEETNLQRLQEAKIASESAKVRKGLTGFFTGVSPQEAEQERIRILRSTAPPSQQDTVFQRHLDVAKQSIAAGKDPLAVRQLLMRHHPERANEIDVELQTPALSTGDPSDQPEAIDEDTGRPVRKLPDGRWVYTD